MNTQHIGHLSVGYIFLPLEYKYIKQSYLIGSLKSLYFHSLLVPYSSPPASPFLPNLYQYQPSQLQPALIASKATVATE